MHTKISGMTVLPLTLSDLHEMRPKDSLLCVTAGPRGDLGLHRLVLGASAYMANDIEHRIHIDSCHLLVEPGRFHAALKAVTPGYVSAAELGIGRKGTMFDHETRCFADPGNPYHVDYQLLMDIVLSNNHNHYCHAAGLKDMIGHTTRRVAVAA